MISFCSSRRGKNSISRATTKRTRPANKSEEPGRLPRLFSGGAQKGGCAPVRGVPALGGKLPAYARKSACAAVRGADSGRKADCPPLLKIPAHLEKATHAIRQAPLFGWAMVGGILWSQQALAFQIFYDSLRRAATFTLPLGAFLDGLGLTIFKTAPNRQKARNGAVFRFLFAHIPACECAFFDTEMAPYWYGKILIEMGPSADGFHLQKAVFHAFSTV